MTEQELRESLISVAPSAIYANESEIVAIAEIAKAYADAQVAAKDAEIKRLRDGVNSALYGLRATHAMSKDDSRRMRKVGSVLKSLLSRAPVTESRHPIALQMYKCNNCQWRGQVGESIETETCDVCPECKSEDLLLYNENEDQE